MITALSIALVFAVSATSYFFARRYWWPWAIGAAVSLGVAYALWITLAPLQHLAMTGQGA